MATPKDKLIASAQKLVEKNQFDKAIAEYLKVVALDDADVRSWLKIGDLYARTNKRGEAAQAYRKVAESYTQQGFFLKAVAVYKQILKLDPTLIEFNQRLANLYRQLGLQRDAVEQLELLAGAHLQAGRTAEVLEAMKQVLSIDSESVLHRVQAAELHGQLGQTREAVQEFVVASQQLYRAKRLEEFVRVAERLLFLAPDQREVSKLLAGVYIDRGEARRALPKLQVCFKGDPKDTEVLSLLASAFEKLEQKPKSVSVLKELARILGERGDSVGWGEAYRRVLSLDPTDADATAALASGAPQTHRAAPASNDKLVEAVPPPSAPRDLQERVVTGSVPLVEESFAMGQGTPSRMSPPSTGSQTAAQGGPAAQAFQGASPAGVQSPAAQGSAPSTDGRRSNEQITRILTEVEVYSKYRLFTKAIEHVQRIFELDPRHLGARDKLKSLYLAVGRRDEALLELWTLADLDEEGRRADYLREILSLDPTDRRASEALAAFAQPMGDFSEAEESREISWSMGDDEVDATAAASAAAQGLYSGAEPLSEVEELVSDDLLVMDESLPIEGVEPVPIAVEESVPIEGDESVPIAVEEFVDESSFVGVQAALTAEPEDRFGLPGEDEASFAELSDTSSRASDSVAEDHDRGATRTGFSDEIDVRAVLDDPALGQAVQGLEAPASEGSDAVAVLSEFDDGLDGHTSERSVPSSEELDALYGGNAEASDEEAVPRPSSALEERLDEADLLIQSSQFAEARAALERLFDEFPGHPLVMVKLRDLEASQAPQEAASVEPEVSPARSQPRFAPEHVLVTVERPLGAIGDLGEPTSGGYEESAVSTGTYSSAKRRNVIEHGVTAEDFDTRYDLGIAYKEMGLFEDALNEFRVVMQDPTREVLCHLMSGLCLVELSRVSDAIALFKKALYIEGITERETTSLFFELGQAYRIIGDAGEALYYLEKVNKRDPRFRGVSRLIEELRGTGGQGPKDEAPDLSDLSDVLDGALGSK